MIDRWIAEATECDFKVALETKSRKAGSKVSVLFPTELAALCFSAFVMIEKLSV